MILWPWERERPIHPPRQEPTRAAVGIWWDRNIVVTAPRSLAWLSIPLPRWVLWTPQDPRRGNHLGPGFGGFGWGIGYIRASQQMEPPYTDGLLVRFGSGWELYIGYRRTEFRHWGRPLASFGAV